MNLYKFQKLMDALGVLTKRRYQIIIYADGSGHFETKNNTTDEYLFSFHDDEERDEKLLDALGKAIPDYYTLIRDTD